MSKVVEPESPRISGMAHAIAGYRAEFSVEFRMAIHRHRWLLALVFAYWIIGLGVGRYASMPTGATVATYLPIYLELMPVILVAFVIFRAIGIVCIDRPSRPLTHIARDLRCSVFTPRRIANGLPMLASMLLFGGTFTLIKASMPALNDYSWDAKFEALDRWLHGGIAPWQYLQPWLGNPLVTHAINIVYAVWFAILGVTWVWQVFSLRDEFLRKQFFWSLLVTWILLGNIAATYLASAGPCYFGRMTGLPDPFEPLMAYLRWADTIHPIWALQVQEMLWRHYLTQQVEVAAGISAMPSLHVAIATLLTLLCWRTHKFLGIAMTLYATAIMIGSVHLGWHYAVDGYAGFLGSCLIWWSVGRCLRRQAKHHQAISE
jgi:hypothetical protein